MRVVTRTEFRALTLAGMCFAVIGDRIYRVGAFVPADIAGALEWGGYRSLLPSPLLDISNFFWLSTLIVGGLGLIFFRRWGRWLLLANYVEGILVSYLSGVQVTYGLQDVVPSLGHWVLLLVLAISFLTPCTLYFTQPSPISPAFEYLSTPLDPTELAVVKSILDASNITYRIESSGMGSLMEGTAVPAALQRRIMVLRDQIAEAREIIAAHASSSSTSAPE